MEKQNFHYIAVLLDMLYGLEMDVEDLEELGLRAWELIGNKDIRLYQYSTIIGPDKSIKLPCNVGEIEAVTTSFEDWNRVTNKTWNGDFDSFNTENNIERYKINKSPYYISGKLVNYQKIGDRLIFDHNYGKINILYKGVFLDEDGLPYLTDAEAHAIATYLAYVDKYKDGLKTNNANLIQLAQNLYAMWLKQCDQARVQKLTQNDINNILNVRDSWNRHTYGFSYKI